MSSLNVRRRASVALAFLVILLSPLAPEAGGQRLLGTPAERLVGHWVDAGGNHWYFAPVGANGLGIIVFVPHEPESKPGREFYRITRQDKTGERVTVHITDEKGRSPLPRCHYDCRIPKDGAKVDLTSDCSYAGGRDLVPLTYVDDKVGPGSA